MTNTDKSLFLTCAASAVIMAFCAGEYKGRAETLERFISEPITVDLAHPMIDEEALK